MSCTTRGKSPYQHTGKHNIGKNFTRLSIHVTDFQFFTMIACRTGVIFLRFSGERRQASTSTRRARVTRDGRGVPVLQAKSMTDQWVQSDYSIVTWPADQHQHQPQQPVWELQLYYLQHLSWLEGRSAGNQNDAFNTLTREWLNLCRLDNLGKHL